MSFFKRRILPFIIIVAVAIFAFGGVIGAQEVVNFPATESNFAEVYQEVSPSVVAISTNRGGGSGFVLDNDGHILTNNHVVTDAADIVLNFVDGTQARAEIVGLDPDSDLAVLKANLPSSDLAELQPVTFADSNALQVGETVLAIGSPFGQRWTLTSGIVSALGRTIQSLGDFSIGGVIQTDAAINPGNSGGPLLNARGEVIGVNSQIISGGANANSGIGFAVPGNLAQRVANTLIEQGFVNYSYIGISGSNVSINVIEEFNLPNDTTGIFVSEAVPGGPAMRAGLQSMETTPEGELVSGDIITAIDGQPLSGIPELISYLAANTEPGNQVELTVLRDGTQTITLNVTLTPRP